MRTDGRHKRRILRSLALTQVEHCFHPGVCSAASAAQCRGAGVDGTRRQSRERLLTSP